MPDKVCSLYSFARVSEQGGGQGGDCPGGGKEGDGPPASLPFAWGAESGRKCPFWDLGLKLEEALFKLSINTFSNNYKLVGMSLVPTKRKEISVNHRLILVSSLQLQNGLADSCLTQSILCIALRIS